MQQDGGEILTLYLAVDNDNLDNGRGKACISLSGCGHEGVNEKEIYVESAVTPWC